jgi:hypothetical protein
MRDILAVDVGTTAFKLGVFSASLEPKGRHPILRRQFSRQGNGWR